MELDYFAPDLTGARFHETINALRRETWLAKSDLGWFVLDREAGSFFLRTKSATFPGLRIAEMFGVEEGPLLEEMRRNILHINGDAHRRLRNLVNPAFTPRSAPQKQPMPKMAVSTPSGKGGSSGVPRTKWVSGMGKGRASRPGSASAGSGIAVLSRKRKLMVYPG